MTDVNQYNSWLTHPVTIERIGVLNKEKEKIIKRLTTEKFDDLADVDQLQAYLVGLKLFIETIQKQVDSKQKRDLLKHKDDPNG